MLLTVMHYIAFHTGAPAAGVLIHGHTAHTYTTISYNHTSNNPNYPFKHQIQATTHSTLAVLLTTRELPQDSSDARLMLKITTVGKVLLLMNPRQ